MANTTSTAFSGQGTEPAPARSPRGAVLIAGPTASGKSALATQIAEAFEGTVINTDAMQLYAGLPLLTAQPSDAERARVPHRLYGVLSGEERASAGGFCRLVAPVLQEAQEAGRLPVFVGGTGLYFKALTDGLSAIPPIDPTIRSALVAAVDRGEKTALREELEAGDPAWAAQVTDGDVQRLLRGLEVLRGTGQALSAWQRKPRRPMLSSPWVGFVLEADRPWLEARSRARFEAMLRKGALDEVAAFIAATLAADHPLRKAIGFRELAQVLDGQQSLEAATEAAQIATRRYAKRQATWFKHQIVAWNRINAQFLERNSLDIFAKVREMG
ncbi:MAG: tRNA (adenosine(37)-N6)-dimethylallyltransferase MiaA [Pseudomonadota bacterium]